MVKNQPTTPTQSELQLQAECFQYTWNYHPETRMCIWHVTNEMKPFPGESDQAFRIRVSKAKAAGLVPGVSDLHFIWDGTLHVFELKVRYNRLSDAQKAFRDKAVAQGAKFYEIREAELFKEIFRSILTLRSKSIIGLESEIISLKKECASWKEQAFYYSDAEF